MGYFSRLFAALAGSAAGPGAASAAAGVMDSAEAEVQARLASLELDLRERDQRIAAMQKEYGTQEAAGRRAALGAGREQLAQLFAKLASPLANLATLAALAEQGREVGVADIVSLYRSVEKQLAAAGLAQLGGVGEQTTFDVSVHQRMSGGAVSAGTEVTVQMPGYRFGDKVLLKAMVTARVGAHG